MAFKVGVSFYSKRTLRNTSGNSSINLDLEKQIVEAIESSPQLRKEIRRTFDIANKRIARLKSADNVVSPALSSINGEKFLVGNTKDWESLKKLYSEAVAFIRSPSSTLGGAKEFTEHVKSEWKNQLGDKATDYHWEHDLLPRLRDAMDDLGEFTGIGTDWGSDTIVQELYSVANADVAKQMEQDAKDSEEATQQVIDDTAKQIASDVDMYVSNIPDMLSDYKFLS